MGSARQPGDLVCDRIPYRRLPPGHDHRRLLRLAPEPPLDGRPPQRGDRRGGSAFETRHRDRSSLTALTEPFVEVEACAKINLRLAVLARETTGYHSLETIFCGISLADTIRVRSAEPGIRLSVEGDIATGPADENLAVRAADRFHQAAGIVPAIHITLEKRIPSGAGLGGGSSDAAATLRLLSTLYHQPLQKKKLLEIAAGIGSDVPFFLTDTPLALAWSRGERLLELPPLPNRHVVVAYPGTPLPTAGAFARLAVLRSDAPTTPPPIAIATDELTSWDRLAPYAANDLEPVAFERIPGLPEALRLLLDSGASIALLAGSGSAIFGIFDDPYYAKPAVRALLASGFATWQARTLDTWPPPRRRIDPNATNK
ncbi:MAG: 4-(cytidine 5'-diphospho)-2-C-methyl-D-erythritol kinase [Gemmatimonas sp.]|nr:4-(cytidine 5'-diphospho)-2-C-methyl-D-erythritol kinase [Gemmatimonas sp.]